MASLEEENPSSWVKIQTMEYTQTLETSLVLLSQSIPHKFHQNTEGQWDLTVELQYSVQALGQLEQYRVENLKNAEAPSLPPLDLSWEPLWVLAIPVVSTFYQAWGLSSHRWTSNGIAHAEKILEGEWWRTVTALSLHGSSGHLAGNLVSGLFVLSLISLRTNLSRIVPLLVLAAAMANYMVALTVDDDFRSLGFSTFVFAALGFLGSTEVRLLPKQGITNRWRRFEPLMACTLLAVMVGLGEGSDVLAHAYGWLAGVIAGWMVPRSWQKKSYSLMDWFAIVATYSVFGYCWWLAVQ